VARRYVLLGAKLLVAAALVAWLLRSGTLDFGALDVLIDRPELLAADLGVLAFAIVLGALRWRLLLRLANVDLTLGRALQLHLTGLFFNIVVPGNIGGDIVKAVYVARDTAPENRATVYLVGFVDRLMGVASLVVVAFGVVVLRGRAALAVPQLREIAIAVAILFALAVGAPLIVILVLRRSRATVAPTGIVGRLVAAARLVATRPKVLVTALGLAITLHLSGLALFALLTDAIGAQAAPLASVATTYPLGMLTMMIPISYAGIGVGHVAFDRLFALVGLTGGATVFNVFLIGQTVPCLLGVFPYLALRRAAPVPTEAEYRTSA